MEHLKSKSTQPKSASDACRFIDILLRLVNLYLLITAIAIGVVGVALAGDSANRVARSRADARI